MGVDANSGYGGAFNVTLTDLRNRARDSTTVLWRLTQDALSYVVRYVLHADTAILGLTPALYVFGKFFFRFRLLFPEGFFGVASRRGGDAGR